jgi:hypothetical protein
MYVSCAQSLCIACSAPEPGDSGLARHLSEPLLELPAYQLYAEQVDPLQHPLLGHLDAVVAFFLRDLRAEATVLAFLRLAI